MPSHSGSCHHLGPYSEKKRTENKISHWIVWGIFAVQTKENPAKAALVFPVSSCHTYPYEERHLTFVFTPTPCVWYSLIHSLLNLCMHAVCVCVCHLRWTHVVTRAWWRSEGNLRCHFSPFTLSETRSLVDPTGCHRQSGPRASGDFTVSASLCVRGSGL